MSSQATDSVRSYLKEIGQHPLLTPEEEVKYGKQVQAAIALENQLHAIALHPELAIAFDKTEKEMRLIKYWGKTAKERMTVANLRLVVMIAKKYQNRNVEFMDLIQEGSLGLCRSIDKFDPNKGYRFSTYAYWWIRQGITRAIAEKSRTIRLPSYLIEALNKIKKNQRELSQSLGRSPTINEIAQASKISSEKANEYLKYLSNTISLNLCIGKDKDIELGELIESGELSLEEQVDQDLLIDYLNNVLSSLTTTQEKVLSLRYGINSGNKLTLDEVARKFNLSRERIRQIENDAIRAIKTNTAQGAQHCVFLW